MFVYSGATAPPRRFSEPDTAAVLIGDLQEQYGCVILSETFKTPLSPTLRRAGRRGRVHLFRRYGATETLLGTRLGSLAGRGGRLRLFRCYGATETLLRTRLGGGIDRKLSRTVWLRDFIGDFQDAIVSNLASIPPTLIIRNKYLSDLGFEF
ncbi:hypothetical protein U1Q18_028883 [Sarracenia purpurea var. burkii]